jgi:hypothetical protein
MVLSQKPDTRVQALNGVNRQWLTASHDALQAAVRRGFESDPVPWPHRGSGVEWSPGSRDRLRLYKKWRKAEAARLDLDPGIVWPADHLKRLALHAGTDAREADGGHAPCVRAWQWHELGASLDAFRHATMGGA